MSKKYILLQFELLILNLIWLVVFNQFSYLSRNLENIVFGTNPIVIGADIAYWLIIIFLMFIHYDVFQNYTYIIRFYTYRKLLLKYIGELIIFTCLDCINFQIIAYVFGFKSYSFFLPSTLMIIGLAYYFVSRLEIKKSNFVLYVVAFIVLINVIKSIF